ncbi:MAG: VOC family protein [Pseudomonadota bacterium]
MIRLAFLKLPVRDLKRAVNFYEAVFDMELDYVAEEYGWALLEGDQLSLALYVPGKGGGNREPGGSVEFQLLHPDVAALHAVLHQEFPGSKAGLHDHDDGARSLEFTDPEGNEVKILEG